jgi:hypothetical protein
MSRKAIADIRKKRGRPAIGEGKPFLVRLRPEDAARLAKWIAKNRPDESPAAIIREFVLDRLKR